MTTPILLFTDASASPQNATAVGGFVLLSEEDLHFLELDTLKEKVQNKIIYIELMTGKSTCAEIETALAALTFMKGKYSQIQLFTDCQNLCYLLGSRRQKLEKAEFKNRAGKEIAHAELYRKLFNIADQFEISVVKVEGHKASKNILNPKDLIFRILDKSVRAKLRRGNSWNS